MTGPGPRHNLHYYAVYAFNRGYVYCYADVSIIMRKIEGNRLARGLECRMRSRAVNNFGRGLMPALWQSPDRLIRLQINAFALKRRSHYECNGF